MLPLNLALLVAPHTAAARGAQHYRGQPQDGRKSSNSCCVNTFINNGIAAPNYHQMDEIERSFTAIFSHATTQLQGFGYWSAHLMV